MPVILFLAYIAIESVALWAVASWIGLGWALIALLTAMLCGMSLAAYEVRRLVSASLRQHTQADTSQAGSLAPQPGLSAAQGGALLGNIGLTMAGGILISLPGFVSSAIGLLLIFPPTRALARMGITARLIRSIEEMGQRAFYASPMARPTYGTFHDPGPVPPEARPQEPTIIEHDDRELDR